MVVKMDKKTKTYLINRYNCIPQKTNATCLKYHYEYNSVHVNVYFDAFDVNSVSFSIVLVYGNKYYYTSLNILNSGIETEYLTKIPSQILSKILVDNCLDDFYRKMETHILEDRPYVNYYNKDKYFINTIRYSKTNLDLPFWSHIRRVRMSDDTLYKLNAKADISLETLQKIQNKGLTLVRTADSTKRKELTIILQRENIELR